VHPEHLTLAQFVAATSYQNDKQFEKFVRSVTPKDQVEEVWLGTVLAILKALWELYQILKALGFFDRWLLRREIKAVMNNYVGEWRLEQLRAVKEKWE
jgi:hypothetical protein